MSDSHLGVPTSLNTQLARVCSRLLGQCMKIVGHKSLTVLIYHRVLAEHDPLRPHEPTVAEFEREMLLLSTCFRPLPLASAIDAIHAGKLPDRAVSVTIDDGYADNEKLALPILEKYGVPATVFVSSGYLNGGRMWNDTVIECIRCLKGREVDLECFGQGVVKLDTVESQRSAIALILQIKSCFLGSFWQVLEQYWLPRSDCTMTSVGM